jgi:hypothetical protein
MTSRQTIHRRGGRLVAAAALPVLLVAMPVGAQSPAASAPVAQPATPARPTIDPDSAVGKLLGMRDTLEADRVLLAELR